MIYLLYKNSKNKFFKLQDDFTISLDETITRNNVDFSKYKTEEFNFEKIANLKGIHNFKISIIIQLEIGGTR
jgi:hypothetical protein